MFTLRVSGLPPPPTGKVDLHNHSIFSDGTSTPTEIFQEAVARGISLLAITDHDTLNGAAESLEISRQFPISFVQGVEIQATDREGQWHHILGLGIDPTNNSLQEVCALNQQGRRNFEEQVLQCLLNRSFSTSCDEYQQFTHDPQLGGWKSLSFAIHKGAIRSTEEYFVTIRAKLGTDQATCVAPAHAIRAIQTAGGLPILAHPVYSKSRREKLPNTLKEFLALGIAGVECYHPHHQDSDISTCLSFCKSHHLVITAGSDSHGSFTPTRTMGSHSLTVEEMGVVFER